MNETSLSLLELVQQQGSPDAWRQLVQFYSPLIHSWLRRRGLHETDVDDVSQEVLTVLSRRMSDFRHPSRTGSFRAWLRTITANCLSDYWRAQRIRPSASGDSNVAEMIAALCDPESSLSRLWDEEHEQFVFRKLLEMIEPQFESKTFEAFRRVAVSGEPAEQVAGELGISVNAVVIAKSRVLAKLRSFGKGILE